MDIKSDLQKFILDNNIVGTMSGVAIALYTKDLILSLSGDVIIPAIFLLLVKINIKSLTKILPNKVNFNLTAFSQNLISWFLGVIITYIFIQITVKYILGISSDKLEEKKNGKKDEKKDENPDNTK